MEWSFPSTNNGQIVGVANAGIETFQGDGIKALIRETCQNSLDAKRENEDTVKMEVKQHYIDSADIPGYSDYKHMLKLALGYWQDNSEKAKKFLEKAIKNIEERTNVVLRISDSNTCGLTEPYKLGFGSWNALTKIDGGATKSGDTQGSFGIGKNAPYMCSAYRMVFYRTLNQDGERAAQGMSRLLSYQIGECAFTTGIGYYGNSDTNGPVESIKELEKLNIRDEIGTDIFVYGLNVVNTNDVKEEVYIEVLDNFIMSIYRKMLTLRFGRDDELNFDTLSKFMTEYKKKVSDSYNTWCVLTSDETKEYERDFYNLGKLKLKILVDSSQNLNRKVLVTRKSGMKLFLMKNISKTISFTAILELDGTKLNEFFREMETPAHDKWKPENHSDPVMAKKYLAELKGWIVDTVNRLGEQDYNDINDVVGLGSILNMNDNMNDNVDKAEGINNYLGNVEKIEVGVPNKIHGYFFAGEGDNNSNKNNRKRKENGVIDSDGSSDAIRVLRGYRKRKKVNQYKGFADKEGEDIISRNIGESRPYPLTDTRIIKIAPGKYKVSYILPVNLSAGYIEFVTVGENGKKIKLNIVDAKIIKNCDFVSVENGQINFKVMKGNEKVQLEFCLPEKGNYAMEVKVYEHN